MLLAKEEKTEFCGLPVYANLSNILIHIVILVMMLKFDKLRVSLRKRGSSLIRNKLKQAVFLYIEELQFWWVYGELLILIRNYV